MSAAFRTVFAQLTPGEVDARWDEVADQLEARFPKAAASMRTAKGDVLAFTPFPFDHWRKIWSNNPVRHEAQSDLAGWKDPPSLRRLRPHLTDHDP